MGGAAAAAAAGAAKRRREEEEEENMTAYSAQDLAEGLGIQDHPVEHGRIPEL
jgi:hypothetical protein